MAENETKYEGVIYRCTCLKNNKVYIGQAVDYKRRVNQHFWHALNDNGNSEYNTHIHRAIRKYGESGFLWEIIHEISECSSDKLSDELNRLEVYYIDVHDSFRNGMNMTPGGGGRSGVPRTEETKEKLRQANLGKKASEETRKRQSLAHKGKHGGPFTDAHKKNLSRAKSFPVAQFTSNGDFICFWQSAREVASVIGIDRSGVQKCCNGSKQYFHGFKWQYI